MKKIITSLLACAGLLAGATQSFAQCTPDESLNEPGVSPSALPAVCENTYYDETIHFAVPTDSTVAFGQFQFTAELDSFEVVSVVGLPNGLDYQCGVGGDNCMTTADPSKELAFNCINIFGTPVEAVSDQEVTVTVKLYFSDQASNNYEYPFEESVTITVNGASSGACVINSVEGQVKEQNIVSAHIYDLTGTEVLESSGKSYKEKMTELPSGIYILRKEMEDGTIETERVFQQ